VIFERDLGSDQEVSKPGWMMVDIENCDNNHKTPANTFSAAGCVGEAFGMEH